MENEHVPAVNAETVAAESPEAPRKATRTRRKAAPKAASVAASTGTGSLTEAAAQPDAETAAVLEAVAVVETAPEAKAPVRRTRARKKPETGEPLPAFAVEATDAPAADAPSPEASASGQTVAADAAEPAGGSPLAEADPDAKPVRRRRVATRKASAPDTVATDAAAPGAGAPDTVATDAAAPGAPDTVATDAATPDAAAPGTASAPVSAAAAAESAPAQADAAAPAGEQAAAEPASPFGSLFLEPGSATSVLFQAPDLTTVARPVPAAVEETEEDDAEEGEGDDANSRRRRRSRGRRGRARGGDSDAGTDADGSEGSEDGAGHDDEEEAGQNDEGVTSRRRRRRRRGDQDLELTGGEGDDPPNTVTRVRAPRAVTEAPVNNRVTSVKGSTRLEAKKQRRRESRDTGRRRTVITEAEFLARRESVDRQMIVRQRDDRIQIGVLEDGVLAEHFVSKTQQDSLIGNVYLGKVQNVLPSMEAAFVDIGRGRNAVLYAGEVNWESVNLEGKQRRIENALKSGDTVLVQVTKDPVGHKGARLTSQISLPGRYLVYVPGGSMTGISRKLPDVERNRLKRILKDRLPEHAGVIVRTAAEGASEEELTHDINRLRAQWEGIESQSTSTKILAPELLYGEPDLTIKVVRDVFNEDFSKLIVSGEEAWDTIEAYVTYVAPDLVGRLEKWTKDQDIFAAWRIDEQIHKALERKVFLPSGGSLVIDRTEAMTVVDVNTGKFTGSGGNLEETVTKNNLEAAEEVVRQLRLRDIGGIIVIDFIDMVLESNRDLVLRRMVECLGRDRTKHQVAEVTSLGLVQMTRKRMGTGLLEVFGEQCETCAGRGIVTHDDPVEHRRANTVAAEHHVQRADNRPDTQRPDNQRVDTRPDAQQGGRTDRKRRRGRGGQPLDVAPAAPVQIHTVHPDPSDAERHAKAEATRAALANIAAAAHAAHLHDDEVAHAAAGKASSPEAPAPAPAQPSETDSTGRPAAVLTFGGEQVVLPFVEHHGEQPQAPALTLDRLAEAFAKLGEPAPVAASAPAERQQAARQTESRPDERQQTERRQAERQQAAEPARQAQASAQAPAAPAADEKDYSDHTEQPRARRPRRNRSASRAQGAANATTVEHHEAASAVTSGHTHAAKAPERANAPAAAAPAETNAPIILGVGVPASEL
jgi:ribonuclease E